MGFLLGLVSNIVANIVFWVLLGAVFWAFSTAVARRFSRFFGLVRVRSVAVFLSNLWTLEGSPTGRPEGYTISLHELRAAQSVEKLFGSAPLRLPEVVRGLVDALWLRRQVQCATEVCPLQAGDADLDRNLIIVGSAVRNSVRARYVRAGLPSAILTGEDATPDDLLKRGKTQSITILRGGSRSVVTLVDANLAIVEKCHDPDRGTTLFFCLGKRGDSTWAATEYLVRNWGNLAREFDDGEFVICLGFPYTEKYLEKYMEPLRLSLGDGGQ
jgi:hypothetical protein